ncbi:MAG TPA: hypothetical protein VFR86_30135 [Burkholderiaceae bacterium]|nr:hypothetical protein [Burkholderiaceae bacterium]
MDISPPAFEALVRRIESAKAAQTIDLSTEEDLSIAVMNLVSLEEHFFFTGVKTDKPEYFDLLNEVRAMRKDLLGRLIDKHEGETWCISKHLLATTMRLIEVGTKLHADGKKVDAKEIFERARQTYALFWGLRLKLIDTAQFRQVAAAQKPWTLQDIVDRLVDCCDE